VPANIEAEWLPRWELSLALRTVAARRLAAEICASIFEVGNITRDETCCSSVRICACMKITGSYGPILVMIVAACFLVAGVGCSLALIIRELRKAPEGYEDEHGFYIVRNGAVKDGVPDSMKSRRTRSSLNWAMNRTLRIKAFRVRGLPFFGKRVPHAASEFSATSRRRAGSCR
jgi:hypothetical protein